VVKVKGEAGQRGKQDAGGEARTAAAAAAATDYEYSQTAGTRAIVGRFDHSDVSRERWTRISRNDKGLLEQREGRRRLQR